MINRLRRLNGLAIKLNATRSYLLAVGLYKENGYYKQAITCYDKLLKLDSTSEFTAQRTQVSRILYYGDDSSDEEAETELSNSNRVLGAPYGKNIESIRIYEVEAKWSSIVQELGMRLLISAPVRKLYFAAKSKIGGFDNMPIDNDLERLFTDSVRKLAPTDYQAIVNGQGFKESITAIITNKQRLLLTLKLKDIDQDLEKLFEIIKSKIISAPVKGMYERHIEKVIAELQEQVGSIENGEIL